MKSLRFSALCYLCLLLFNSPAFCQSQQQWVKRYSLVGSATNQATVVALSPDGNIVVGGSSAGTSGDLDYVAIAYSPSGQQVWLTRYDSPTNGSDQLRGMAVDGGSNALLTGTSMTVKLGPAGAVIWAAPYSGRAIAMDTNGNAYVTGFSELDYATAKLDPNGTNLWVRTYDYDTLTNRPDISNVIAVGVDGTVAVSGVETKYGGRNLLLKLVHTIAYDSEGNQAWSDDGQSGNDVSQVANVTSVVTDGHGGIAFMANFPGFQNFVTEVRAPGGALQWVWVLDQDAGVASDGTGTSMAQHSDGGLYLAGTKGNNYTGDKDYAIVRLGTNGHKIWLSTYHGPVPGENRINAMALDSSGSAYVTGYSPGVGSGRDIATIKYDSNGNQLWVHRYNGPANGDDIGTGIVLDGKGGVYVTGYSATTNGGTEFVTIKYLDRPSISQPQARGDGNFQFQLNSWAGTTNTVETSSNLANWSALTSIVVTNVPMPVVDLGASNFATRFYRVRVP